MISSKLNASIEGHGFNGFGITRDVELNNELQPADDIVATLAQSMLLQSNSHSIEKP